MTERNSDKINPLIIANKSTTGESQQEPIGFVVICNEEGMPVLHEIPDHRTPNNAELFHINWFLAGSIVGRVLVEPEDKNSA